MGAPSPAVDVLEADGSLAPLALLLSRFEPGRIGIDGLSIDMRVLVDASGLL